MGRQVGHDEPDQAERHDRGDGPEGRVAAAAGRREGGGGRRRIRQRSILLPGEGGRRPAVSAGVVLVLVLVLLVAVLVVDRGGGAGGFEAAPVVDQCARRHRARTTCPFRARVVLVPEVRAGGAGDREAAGIPSADGERRGRRRQRAGARCPSGHRDPGRTDPRERGGGRGQSENGCGACGLALERELDFFAPKSGDKDDSSVLQLVGVKAETAIRHRLREHFGHQRGEARDLIPLASDFQHPLERFSTEGGHVAPLSALCGLQTG